MAFEQNQKVLFKHCDPAGIVFFPRYFEMMNDCVEAFFDECLAFPFEEVLKVAGVPTAEIETKFLRPSRHGDRLVLRIDVLHVGRSSMRYQMTAECAGEQRFVTKAALVHVDGNGRPTAWPDRVRALLMDHLIAEDAGA